MPSPSRDHALSTLDQTPLPHWPKPNLRKLTQAPSDPRDFALAEQLTIGVIKNHLHLLHLQTHYSGKKLSAIHPLVQKILSIALYQLRFLTRIPPSAAINEAVNQAKHFGQSHAAGFINAILRNAARQPNPPLPDPHSDPAAYAELVLSHPRPLFDKLVALLGPPDALRFCEHDNAQPPTILRLYPNITPEQIQHPDITLTPHHQPGLYVISPARPAFLADLAQRGLAQVQDPTAALVVPQLNLHPGQSALDRCCGLGTKTLQLHSLLAPISTILATDPSQERCRTLINLLSRRHITDILVRPVGMLADLSPTDPQAFDRILIDAPCSNSGVLARRPEARYHQSPQTLSSLAQLQDRILDDTAPHLLPDGRLVYSTCSVWPEENRQRIDAFLSRHPDYQLLHDQLTLPSFTPQEAEYRDGGYFAVMVRP